MKIPTKLSVYIMGAAILFHKIGVRTTGNRRKDRQSDVTFTSVVFRTETHK